jgi:membrane-associated protease RseP (regulator of RpoE activity)
MTQRSPVRRAPPARPATRKPHTESPIRRTRTVRRASAGLSPIRAGALLAMLLAATAVYGVANSSAFVFEDLRLEGAAFTDPAVVEEALEDVRGRNLFGLRTGALEGGLRELPTVRDADVSVRLPDSLVVRVEERTPILVWRVGARRYLADADGRLFARIGEDPAEAAAAKAAALPVVEDRRAASAGLSVGGRLEAVDLDAATRLASLGPADVGSEADALTVAVSDANGFVIRARPDGWSAVFGFYTLSLRTPELIPGQVRLLRSLLVGREPLIERVILASETDGTYTLKPTPRPSATPSP